MTERIHHRPELGNALLDFARLVELFEATQNEPEMNQIVLTAIVSTLSRINLEEEELVLVQPQLSRERSKSTLQQREEPTDRITNGYTGFYLCSASEGRLLKSLEDTGVVLVNGFLLAKMVGKISALALETKEGFVAGHWYAPRTSWMREAIRQSFDKGVNRVTIPNDVWDYMRQANVSNLINSPFQLKNNNLLNSISSEESLLEFCARALAQLPDQFGANIKGLSRQQYRMRYKEGE